MVEIVSIVPSVREKGLIAYECPRCGYVTSVVQPRIGTTAKIGRHSKR
jgi:hypothetical protein